jgi:hypothetical protein
MPVPLVFEATGGDARFTIAARESTTYPFRRDPGPATNSDYGGAPYLGLTIEAPRSDRLIEVAEHPRQRVPPQRPDAHGRGHAGGAVPIVTTSMVDLPPRGLGVALPGWLRAAAGGALRLPG